MAIDTRYFLWAIHDHGLEVCHLVMVPYLTGLMKGYHHYCLRECEEVELDICVHENPQPVSEFYSVNFIR